MNCAILISYHKLSLISTLNSGGGQALLSAPAYRIFEVVNLTNELLPPLPQDIMSIAARSSLFVQGSLYKESPISSTGEEHDMTGNATAISGRVKLLNEQPQLLKKFGLDLLPLLIQMYASSVKAPVRHKSLSIVGEFMHFSTPVNKACIHVSIKH